VEARGLRTTAESDGRALVHLGGRAVAALNRARLDEVEGRLVGRESIAAHLGRERALAAGEWVAQVHVETTADDRDAAMAALIAVASDALRESGPAMTLVSSEDAAVVALAATSGAVAIPGAQVWVLDWRRVAPLAWMASLGRATSAAPRAAVPYTLFTHESFAATVRQALRDFHDPTALRRNALLRARVVLEVAGEHAEVGARVAVLRELCGRAAASLGSGDERDKLQRALRRAYLEPAPSQERAAELLGLPLSTFRRHLDRAVAHVVEVLWRAELEGVGALPSLHQGSEP
jgi:hypothetical protein